MFENTSLLQLYDNLPWAKGREESGEPVFITSQVRT